MKKMKITLLLAALFMSGFSGAAQQMKIETMATTDPDYQDIVEQYGDKGEIKHILSARTTGGHYSFVFVEQPLKTEVHPGMETTTYGVKKDGSWGEVKKVKEEDTTYVTKNLRAWILLSDHGGYDEMQKFQDFGNEVYWPNFIYKYCFIRDADGDGEPEFYLTYFGESDGLDSKPLKVIVYDSSRKVDGKFLKAKATAWYPAGNEDDRYRVEYDEAWLTLPDEVKKVTKDILDAEKGQH